MYASTHRAEHSPAPPQPAPIPRPGVTPPPAPAASAYDFADVPAAPLNQLGQWLSA